VSTSTVSEPKTRFLSLRLKLTLAFVLLSILSIGVSIGSLYIFFRQKIRDDLKQRVTSLVDVAALQQNGDEFARISSEQDQLYEKFRTQYLAIRGSDPDIAYVWAVSKDEQGFYFVVDASEPGEKNVAKFGERYNNPSPTLTKNYDKMTTTTVDPAPYDSYWSAYAPIFKGDQRVGVIAVGLRVDTITQKERQFLLIALILFVVVVPLTTRVGWSFGTSLTEPIIELTYGAAEMSSGDFNKRVAVYSDDEVGKLVGAFNQLGRQISSLITGLEVRVIERTRELQMRTIDLENLSKQTEERASKFQAVALLARAITSVQNIEELLPRITTVVSQEFGFYHVGIFLLDQAQEYAILRAANSEGGQKMVERGHALKVGEVGMVGYTASTGQVRIASDTGADAVFFDNPDLPDTRSEMTMPLRIGNDIIGVLDVQSNQSAAFQDQDVELLTIVADQISIAIQNARQFQSAQKALTEAEVTSRQYVRREWTALSSDGTHLGYRYSRAGVGPLKAPVRAQEIDIAILTGKTHSTTSPSQSQLAVPIKLRGEIIGVLNVKSEGQRKWDQDEIDISEAVAERVALAIENARLVEASQTQAARERTIGEIASRIGASVNMRNVLQTAVEELGRVLPGSDVIIQLGNNANEDK
jgi:GAF domain-containing protein/HAMP domain-containing protein